MNPAPLGVFDSGIGGLTVARALFERLPHESVIYFGDTARVPYGPKSPETVRRYSAEILAYLVQRGVKALVVACNTITAQALDYLRGRSPVPLVGVIEPGARAAAQATETGRIGVIGTAGTIASRAYERAIKAIRPDATVHARACPLLVPLVEEGWFDHAATELIAHEYLDPLHDVGVDVLVLGCTPGCWAPPCASSIAQRRRREPWSGRSSSAASARPVLRIPRIASSFRTTSRTSGRSGRGSSGRS